VGEEPTSVEVLLLENDEEDGPKHANRADGRIIFLSREDTTSLCYSLYMK